MITHGADTACREKGAVFGLGLGDARTVEGRMHKGVKVEAGLEGSKGSILSPEVRNIRT